MPRHLQHLRRLFQRELLVRPLFWGEFGYLPACGLGDAGEHVAQILMRIDAAPPATFDNRVDHGTALSRVGVSKKQPVLLADGRGSNRIFHAVVVDFDAAVGDILGEKILVRECVAE